MGRRMTRCSCLCWYRDSRSTHVIATLRDIDGAWFGSAPWVTVKGRRALATFTHLRLAAAGHLGSSPGPQGENAAYGEAEHLLASVVVRSQCAEAWKVVPKAAQIVGKAP